MKALIEKVNVVYALVVIFTGVGMIASVMTNQQEIALASISGLVGFLGGNASPKN